MQQPKPKPKPPNPRVFGPPRTEKFIYDHSGNVMTKVITEDVEPVIEHVKNIRNNTPNGFGPTREMRHIGSVPMAILDQWFKEGFNPFKQDPDAAKEVKRRLNDMNKFRTTDGML